MTDANAFTNRASRVEKPCRWCQKPFLAMNRNDDYCCIGHRDAARKQRRQERYQQRKVAKVAA